MEWLRAEIERIKEENLYRRRRLREGLLDFCSNDYLGLRDNPSVIEASVEALREYGLGSGASQLVSGYTHHHRELEERLAGFKGTPSCLVFGSGYLANLGVIPALAGEGDLLLSDSLNHASIIDGCRLSKAEVSVYPHRDYRYLRRLLEGRRKNYRRVLIITDAVFSMEGDVADVEELYELCERYDCLLYLDEAHSTGTLGEGRGILRETGLPWREFVVLMGTLSKALGSYGAFVCGSRELIDFLINRARSAIFSTSLPPSVCAGAKRALELVEENPQMVEELRNMSRRLHSELVALGLDVPFHDTPIIPIIVGDEQRALEVSRRLLQEGILLQAIRYPTVPKGEARLRLTVSLRYTEGDIERLLKSLAQALSI